MFMGDAPPPCQKPKFMGQMLVLLLAYHFPHTSMRIGHHFKRGTIFGGESPTVRSIPPTNGLARH